MDQHKIDTLRTAAASGDPHAQYELAMLHIYGNGVEEDNAKAISLLTSAAAQGYSEATNNLGVCYHYGYGTEPDLQKTYDFYRRSADQGYGKGCCLVGEFYYDGLCVTSDCDQAVQWFLKALGSEDISAVAYGQFLLGRCSELGHGLPQDLGITLQWYRQSAKNGDEREKIACLRLDHN